MTKICTTCKILKDTNEFPRDKHTPSGIHSRCKVCHRKSSIDYYRSHRMEMIQKNKQYQKNHPEKTKIRQRNKSLKRDFSITLDQYNDLLKKQDYKCAICKRKQTKFKRALAVDHCHKTNRNRGLLCGNCNMAIGLFKEKIFFLKSAIDYLYREEKASY